MRYGEFIVEWREGSRVRPGEYVIEAEPGVVEGYEYLPALVTVTGQDEDRGTWAVHAEIGGDVSDWIEVRGRSGEEVPVLIHGPAPRGGWEL